jgi:transcription antitermination factor NusG
LSDPTDSPHWYVAVTLPRLERIAQKQYERLGIETFLPLRERPPTPERPLVVEPIWAGYVFVTEPIIPTAERLFLTAPYQLQVRELSVAVRGIVSARNGDPIQVPPRFIERLMAKADADGLIDKYEAPPRWEPKAGDEVRIKFGVFAGSFGIIEKTRGVWVKISFSCFGGRSMLDTTLEQIEAAA